MDTKNDNKPSTYLYRTYNTCIKIYPQKKKEFDAIIKKINNIKKIKPNSKILEIGAAQGLMIIAATKSGYDIEGIEPDENSIEISKELSKKFDCPIPIKKAYAEKLPYRNNSFDIIIADSVLEHVKNIKKTLKEIHRVLKPGGCFYFFTSSSLCPKQNEIKGFPLFSWYPDPIKKKIMFWTMKNKPKLIAFTNTPAINWLTPWKAKKLMKQTGFRKSYDRYDLLIEKKIKSNPKRHMIRFIRSSNITRIIADIFYEGCRYVWIK